jgi:hypothetical protein
MTHTNGLNFGATRNGKFLRATVIMAATALAATLARPSGGRASTTTPKCKVLKLKAVGRVAGATFKCNAKAVGMGTAIEASCVDKAAAAFVATFGKADVAGTCGGNSSSMAATVGALVDTSLAAVHPGAERSRCAGKKLKADGALATKSLTAHANRIAGEDDVKFTLALAKASAAFGKAFSAAEGESDCQTMGDVTASEAMVSSFVSSTERTINCGDGLVDDGEQCDGTPLGHCAGSCESDCTCEVLSCCEFERIPCESNGTIALEERSILASANSSVPLVACPVLAPPMGTEDSYSPRTSPGLIPLAVTS